MQIEQKTNGASGAQSSVQSNKTPLDIDEAFKLFRDHVNDALEKKGLTLKRLSRKMGYKADTGASNALSPSRRGSLKLLQKIASELEIEGMDDIWEAVKLDDEARLREAKKNRVAGRCREIAEKLARKKVCAGEEAVAPVSKRIDTLRKRIFEGGEEGELVEHDDAVQKAIGSIKRGEFIIVHTADGVPRAKLTYEGALTRGGAGGKVHVWRMIENEQRGGK